MGLFGNPRKKIEKWAPIVMEGYTPGILDSRKRDDEISSLIAGNH